MVILSVIFRVTLLSFEAEELFEVGSRFKSRACYEQTCRSLGNKLSKAVEAIDWHHNNFPQERLEDR
jgi:hypothetical protein